MNVSNLLQKRNVFICIKIRGHLLILYTSIVIVVNVFTMSINKNILLNIDVYIIKLLQMYYGLFLLIFPNKLFKFLKCYVQPYTIYEDLNKFHINNIFVSINNLFEKTKKLIYAM